MPASRSSPDDHEQFDELCARLDEFEPLPSMADLSGDTRLSAGEQLERTEEQTPLDGLILAGLVAPY